MPRVAGRLRSTGVTEPDGYRGRRDASTVLNRKERVLSVRQVREAVLR
jgi:hypothetical protein